jgi:hypothetical protein
MNKFNTKINFFSGGGAQFSSFPQAQKNLVTALPATVRNIFKKNM